MNKHISAEKCKDGYLVEITTTIPVNHLNDVLNIIRYEGLRMRKEFSTKIEQGKNAGEYQRIFAD